MLESAFKRKQRLAMQKEGWKFITQEPGGGVPQGFPDTLILSPTGYHCFTEWKKEKDAEKRPLQDYWNEKLNSMGHDAYFVYPENVEEWKREVTIKSAHFIPFPRGLSSPLGE